MRGRRQILDLFRRWDGLEQKIDLNVLMEALAGLVIKPGDLAGAVDFDDRSYLRTVIHGREHYQALVLCWRSGQSSPIHDHRALNFRRQSRIGVRHRNEIQRGSMRPARSGRVADPSGRIGDRVLRRRYPSDGQPRSRTGNELITLHVYSPPPASWRTFRVCDTTLADDDRLIRKPPRTVRVELAHASPIKPMGSRTRGGIAWRS